MGISTDLHRVVVARLRSQIPDVKVYDRRVPEGADFPYIRIGPFYGIDESVECVNVQSITAQIDVFGSAYPDSGQVNDLTDAVRKAVNGWADTDAITMPPLRVSLWRVMDDPDPTKLHGVVQVEARVEDGEA